MSCILQREQIPPITMWRRSEHEDVAQILNLFSDPMTTDLFGNVNVSYLIEHSCLSLSEINEKEDIVGFISVLEYPNIPDMLDHKWLQWLQCSYELPETTHRNTLFIHLLVWNSKYTFEFLEPLLHAVFLNRVYVDYLMILVPPNVLLHDTLLDFFTPVAGQSHVEQHLYMCPRQTTIPRLKFRLAIEEDSDAVASIINKITKQPNVMYGDYWMAELLAHPTTHRQVIVGEMNNTVIGMASINTDINLEILNEHFELGPFHGLRCPDKRDEFLADDKLHESIMKELHIPVILHSEDSLSVLFNLDSLFEGGSSSSSAISSSSSSLLSINQLSNESLESNSDDYIIVADDELSSYSYDIYYRETQQESSSEDSSEYSSHKRSIRETFENCTSFHNTNIPNYYGVQNAFAIELFGMIETCDERLAFDFLGPIFDCVPDMDYCIMTIPTTYPVFPLLQHFVRVPPRPDKDFGHELYIVHRNALLSALKVRVTESLDHDSVLSLLGSIEGKDIIYQDFVSAINCENSPFKAYVLALESEVVGLAVVTAVDNMEYLYTHYNIEDCVMLSAHKCDQHGFLKHLVLSPIFYNNARFFLQEIHRQSNFTCLYHKLLHRTYEEDSKQSMVTLLGELIPVKPRRQIQYDLEVLEENRPRESVLHSNQLFALLLMNKRLNSLPKTAINERIVVVGASDVSLSFLETLIFGPTSTYLYFNNITIVSLHGFPEGKFLQKTTDKLLIFKGRYNSSYISKISLRSWVNLTYGVMTSINRIKKYIVVSGREMLPYDYLMLFCGEQLQKPDFRLTRDVKKCKRNRKRTSEDLEELPLNVFIINTEIDASNSLTALKSIVTHKVDYKIIVYGHSLSSFCCVAALQDIHIPNNNIVFVEPFPSKYHTVSVFNNHEIDEAVMRSMKREGIIVYSSYHFSRWEKSPNESRITKATFQSETRELTLECVAMFYYGKKEVSQKTFHALHKASIIYDGHVVIDNQYHTNDPFIYAAGSLTKYARRYYADKFCHKYYNSMEIGENVAKKMLCLWYPCIHKQKEQDPALVPTFYKPLVVSCLLPGGINYLNISKPGLKIPLDAAMGQDTYGQALVTGSCTSKQGYFRLHINNFNSVETITCYTKNSINVSNLMSLYGKHEELLNSLVERFNCEFIQDFYKYFQEPWIYAIFHDQFHWLQRCYRQMISDSPLLKRIAESTAKLETLSNEEIMALQMMYMESGAHAAVCNNTLQFLEDNAYLLPMYVLDDDIP